MHKNIITCSFCFDSNISQFQLVGEKIWLVLTEGQYWIHSLHCMKYRGEHLRHNVLCDSTVQRLAGFCAHFACSVLYPGGTGDVKMNVFDMMFSQQRRCHEGWKGVSLFWTSLLPSENRSRYWGCLLSPNAPSVRAECLSGCSPNWLRILIVFSLPLGEYPDNISDRPLSLSSSLFPLYYT
jgi:hypothetical protein